MKRKLIWIISIALLFVLTCEMVFRIRYKTRYHVQPIFQENAYLGYKFRANYYLKSPNRIIPINKYGYLGNNWKIEKDSNVYRIAVIDNCYGVGGHHIVDSNYYNYPELTETELKHRGYNVEVLNFSVPGATRSLNLFQSIAYDIVKFHPDLILLRYDLPFVSKDLACGNYKGWNIEFLQGDSLSRKRVELLTEKFEKNKKLISLYNHSYFLVGLGRNYRYRFPKTRLGVLLENMEYQGFTDYEGYMKSRTKEIPFGESVKMIKALRQKLNAQNLEIFLFQFDAPGNQIFSTCKTNKLPLLSLSCNFTEEMYYPKDGHINNLGQIEIQNKLVKTLEKLMP